MREKTTKKRSHKVFAIRSILKWFKILVRRNRFLDKLYLYARYGKDHPLSAKYWDRIWQDEGLETWRTYRDKFDFITSLVPARQRVLDVGCGVGILLSRLKKESQCEVFGVDISPVAIEIAKQTGIPGLSCQLPILPLDSDFFDVVIATEVIEHLLDPKKTINQMCRVLRGNGTMILSTPNDSIPPGDCDEHFHCFNEISLRELVSEYLINVQTKVLESGDESFVILWGRKPL